jgi:hypothetical protein
LRGCLTFVATIVVVAAALAWLLPPPVADAVLSQSLSVVLGGPTTAQVRTSFPPSLLTLHADRVDVTGTSASFAGGALRASNVSLRLSNVDMLSRTAGAVEGSLDGVTIQTTELGPVSVERIVLSGPSGALDATATIGASEANRMVAAAVTSATGRPASAVALVPPDAARATVGGVVLSAHLLVSNGDLVVRPDRAGVGPMMLLKASSLAPFQLTGVAVENGGLVLSGRLTGAALGF